MIMTLAALKVKSIRDSFDSLEERILLYIRYTQFTPKNQVFSSAGVAHLEVQMSCNQPVKQGLDRSW